jgi:hypothetical protein
MDLARLVEVYVITRDKRAVLKKEYEERDAELKLRVDKIEEALLDVCKETGVESLRTNYGTATRVVKERVWSADWDAFKEFVREHDAIDLLEHRIHQGNYKEWAASNPDVVAPVNIDRRYAVTVRRSS